MLLVVFIMAVSLISIQISRVERAHSLRHADEAEKSRLGGCLAVMGFSVWSLGSGSKGRAGEWKLCPDCQAGLPVFTHLCRPVVYLLAVNSESKLRCT